MSRLARGGLIHEDCLTVTGLSQGQNIEKARIKDDEVIRPLDRPYHPTGGLAVLRGSLAPDGAVVKQSAVAPEMLVHTGPARVFDSEEEAFEAIQAQKILDGDVIVIRYEGPKGGPGMREMLTPTSALAGMGMDKTVALITTVDSRELHEAHRSDMSRPKQRLEGPSPLSRKAIRFVSTSQTRKSISL